MIEKNNFKGQSFSKIGDFKNKFDFAADKKAIDIMMIENKLDHLKNIRSTSDYEDMKGGDYVGINKDGIAEYIDIKRRQRGCSKYWKYGPEVAIELESVVTGGKYNIPEGRIGWTLDDKKNTDWIIYAFDRSDSTDTFCVPFRILKQTVREHLEDWKSKYRITFQDSGQWQSSSMFIPLSIVSINCKRNWIAEGQKV